jgi:hypothetical protein
MTAPKAWEMAATAGEEPQWSGPILTTNLRPTRVDHYPVGVLPTAKRSYRAALTKAYRWLLARLGLR